MTSYRQWRSFAARVVVAAAATLFFLTAGCTHPRAIELRQRRENHLKRTVAYAELRESQRPQKLDQMLAGIEERHHRDETAFSQSVERVEDRLRSDEQRWQRRLPLYEREFERGCAGDLDHAERTLIEILY
jgi:hypothetical protein